MLADRDIKTNFDADQVELSPLVVRKTLDRTGDGEIEETPELQFQLTNVSGGVLVDLDVEVNYYSSEKVFAGCDSDVRLEPLKPGETHTFWLLIEPPDHVSSAELTVSARSQTISDRVPFWLKMGLMLALLVAVYYLSWFR